MAHVLLAIRALDGVDIYYEPGVGTVLSALNYDSRTTRYLRLSAK